MTREFRGCVRVRWGQTERPCGKVGARSDELAPDNDSPEVQTAGQGHDACYLMRLLDQINALVAVADAGEGVGGLGVWARGAAEGSGLKSCTFVGASMGIELSPDASAKAIPYGTEAAD